MPKDLTASMVQKKLSNTPPLLPSFYVCPYADAAPGTGLDYSLIYYPPETMLCDINIAFFTPDEDKTKGTYGNTVSDTFLTHQRDKASIIQFVERMESLNRRIIVSYIDTPTIHWDTVNVENFARNTEGEVAPDGTFFSNALIETYHPVGRMWDAETPTPEAMGKVIKACFLRGLQHNPDNLVFVYTTYANRDVDSIILNMAILQEGDAIDQALYALGFRQISDFITMRGSLSFLETMSYGSDYTSRFQEADAYALQLAKGDASLMFEMRKFISIGVAPGLSSKDDAIQIARACNPETMVGYGRFMVWAGNCPDGLDLFQLMLQERQAPVPEQLAAGPILTATPPRVLGATQSGNRHHFFKHQHAVEQAMLQLTASTNTLSC